MLVPGRCVKIGRVTNLQLPPPEPPAHVAKPPEFCVRFIALVVSGVFMDMVEECRTHAEKCRELANSMTTPVDQHIFDWMAQVWEKLADLRKLDSEPEPEA